MTSAGDGSRTLRDSVYDNGQSGYQYIGIGIAGLQSSINVPGAHFAVAFSA